MSMVRLHVVLTLTLERKLFLQTVFKLVLKLVNNVSHLEIRGSLQQQIRLQYTVKPALIGTCK
jgi:hypothetical protein